ncbi:MAG: hypothetical protein AAF602_07455, partial [Myxococcota bacterium]
MRSGLDNNTFDAQRAEYTALDHSGMLYEIDVVDELVRATPLDLPGGLVGLERDEVTGDYFALQYDFDRQALDFGRIDRAAGTFVTLAETDARRVGWSATAFDSQMRRYSLVGVVADEAMAD